MPTLYLAVYARIEIDKHADPGERITYKTTGENGSPVYICGPATPTLAEAETLAREAVNNHEGVARGPILPRVFKFGKNQEGQDENLIDVCYRAQEWYEKKLADLNESDEITAEPNQRRYHDPDDPRPMQKLSNDQVRELRGPDTTPA